jgi:hypothetical protein
VFHVTQTAKVPPAEVGPISDEVLARLIGHMHDLENNRCTEEGATLILMCARPCLEELMAYRKRTAASLELVPDNVIRLPLPEA